MSSSFAEEQKKTNPQSYHQVIALSARLINDSLYKMWNQAQKEDPLRKYGFSMRAERLSMFTAPPRVSIAIDDAHNQHLFYHMHVTQGDLQIYESEQARDPSNFSLEGVELVFPVTIESEILQPGNPEHNKWATSTGFTDEAFSISRLYLHFTKIASTFDEKRSILPPKLKGKPAAVAGFANFIGRHASTMTQQKSNFVGVQIKPKDACAKVSRDKMVPTSMEYVVYPWKENGRTVPQADDRNCLCILSMTDFVPPPQTPKLDYSGPFTEGGATLCLHRELLWDKWLLEEAKTLLKAVHIVPLPPHLGPPKAPKSYVTTYPRFTIGSTLPTSSYKWTASNDGWTWKAAPAKEIVTGTYSNIPQEASDEASSQVKVSFAAEGSKVIFTGDLMKRFQHQNRDGSRKSDSIIGAKWTAQFDLFACRSGTLAVSRATSNVQLEPLRATQKQNWWIWNGSGWELRAFSSWQAELSTEFGSALKKTLGSLTNNMQKKLEDRHRLFLPGGGAFTVRDPKFNKRGDLLASLVYHEYDPPKHTQQEMHVLQPIQRFVLSPKPAEENKPPAPKGKCLLANNACGDSLPPAWRVVPEEQQHLPERQPLIPAHELHHEIGKIVSPEIAIEA